MVIIFSALQLQQQSNTWNSAKNTNSVVRNCWATISHFTHKRNRLWLCLPAHCAWHNNETTTNIKQNSFEIVRQFTYFDVVFLFRLFFFQIHIKILFQ